VPPYHPAVNFVTVAIVSNDVEAEVACGLLRTNGIKSAYRKTDIAYSAWEATGQGGPTAILVAAEDVDRAKELLSR
jgi:hypothetical protein